MQYSEIENLKGFLKEVEVALLDEGNRKEVKYRTEFTVPWNSEKLIQENEELLSSLSGKANIYAIFTAEAESETYSLKYIGKSRKHLSRARLINHLIKKHDKTGAKLGLVIDHVQAKGKIKISWVAIEPESLRNYIEEELINSHSECSWNKHAKSKA